MNPEELLLDLTRKTEILKELLEVRRLKDRRPPGYERRVNEAWAAAEREVT